MKKIHTIGIISMILGFILLIPSFLYDTLKTIFLLLELFGITFIFIALIILLYPKRINNRNSN